MIRVLIPSMPTADELLPFLREIDERKVYVNGGPLVRRLEAKIAERVGSPCTVVSNGTLSLELALRAMNLPQGCGVLVPAVTYVASAQAIVNAGLVPVICDIDPDTWQLDADDAFLITQHQPKIRAVMPVATYGIRVPIEPWEKFTYDTNLPVLIDAAGALANQESSPIPEIVLSFSLHATKAIGCGEGGAVVTADRTLLERVESLANFGVGGTNAKMSEYHAAVGLASLERNDSNPMHLSEKALLSVVSKLWRDKLACWYSQHLPAGVSCELTWGLGASLFPVLLPPGRDAAAIGEHLLSKGIETRQWYRPFLDEREFAHCPMQPTRQVTEYLRRRCLGLPWHEFLTEDDVRTVCAALAEAIA